MKNPLRLHYKKTDRARSTRLFILYCKTLGIHTNREELDFFESIGLLLPAKANRYLPEHALLLDLIKRFWKMPLKHITNQMLMEQDPKKWAELSKKIVNNRLDSFSMDQKYLTGIVRILNLCRAIKRLFQDTQRKEVNERYVLQSAKHAENLSSEDVTSMFEKWLKDRLPEHRSALLCEHDVTEDAVREWAIELFNVGYSREPLPFFWEALNGRHGLLREDRYREQLTGPQQLILQYYDYAELLLSLIRTKKNAAKSSIESLYRLRVVPPGNATCRNCGGTFDQPSSKGNQSETCSSKCADELRRTSSRERKRLKKYDKT